MADSLEAYVLLGKNTAGKALVSLIQQVIAHPSIFTFTEFLKLKNMDALEMTDDQRWIRLLRLFSHGTYEQYQANKSDYPELGIAELSKLKKLSLLSLALESHHLSYSMLMKSLDLPTTRALEDLVIDANYSSLVKAKLNTRSQLVYIESTSGRDLDPEGSLIELIGALKSWSGNCDTVLAEIQNSIHDIKLQGQIRRHENAHHTRAIEEARKQIQSQSLFSGAGSTTRSKRSAGFGSQTEDVLMDEELQPGRWQGISGGSSEGAMGPGNRKRKTPLRVKK